MPVIEFADRRPNPEVYRELPADRWREIELRRPFSLLADHFEFAWRLAKKIDLGQPTVHGLSARPAQAGFVAAGDESDEREK